MELRMDRSKLETSWGFLKLVFALQRHKSSLKKDLSTILCNSKTPIQAKCVTWTWLLTSVASITMPRLMREKCTDLLHLTTTLSPVVKALSKVTSLLEMSFTLLTILSWTSRECLRIRWSRLRKALPRSEDASRRNSETKMLYRSTSLIMLTKTKMAIFPLTSSKTS